MKIISLKKAIETLEAQNENGQFDQVIYDMKVQLLNLQKAEKEANEEGGLDKLYQHVWGMTEKEFYAVVKKYQPTLNPTKDAYELNNKQMKVLAHQYYNDRNLFWVDGEIKTRDEAYDEVVNNIDEYIDIYEFIWDNLNHVDEKDIYNALIVERDDEFETDEDGNVVYEEDEVA